MSEQIKNVLRNLAQYPPFSFVNRRFRPQLLKLYAALLEFYWRLTDRYHIFQPKPVSPGSYLKKFARLNRPRRADIVVCVHNAPDDTVRCLQSIREHTNLRFHRLILVDDGSGPETADIVRNFAIKAAARYIRNERALGYTVAANLGLRAGTGEYCVLLNSDTIVTPNWLEALIECANVAGPKVACVGPLSNAASWQSIPKLRDPETKGWAVNELPAGMSPADAARRIAASSPRVYPRVNFVNGFCFLITRQALDAVGLLDEVTFPRGYGEEDDFAIRSRDAGFTHHIADDCYVFHAKSKSFTVEGRKKIVGEIRGQFLAKHGAAKIDRLLHETEFNEELLKARVAATLALESVNVEVKRASSDRAGYRLAWLAPHLEPVGGIRRLIEMTNRLRAWGFETFIITPDGETATWAPILSRVISSAEAETMPPFDVLVYTDPMNVIEARKLGARMKICYHLAAYHLYRPKTDELAQFYAMDENVVHLANSSWTAEQLKDFYPVAGIFPGGIDHTRFKPVNVDKLVDVTCYGSTRRNKGTRHIKKATRGKKLLAVAELKSSQDDLARHYSAGRVFVSACDKEGFNFCPLEAMACGIPVVMTDDGGSREYAVHHQNACVVDGGSSYTRTVRLLSKAIDYVLTNKGHRLTLIENGMRTAARFSWDQVTSDFADFLQARLAKRYQEDAQAKSGA